ncbi:hypothetical protein CHS0354_000737 [Potamilus streckersoni]|uniref:NADPH--hemoprotein reductase n=1 Tax=Potamilus streckersoni TaxID=2493646 RepID=A0AAE0W871_9BIVA|nr:hypothetical protein CHS0354_000737 [Potamilus streckersoni]
MLKKIPYPRLYPILKHLPHIDIKRPVGSTVDVAKNYYPIMQLIYPNGETMVVISSAKLATEVLDETRFTKSNNKALAMMRKYVLGDGLFTALTKEANWEKAHRILMPSFGKDAMKNFHPKMLEAASHLLAKWHNLPNEHYFNLTDDMTRLTFDTIGLCGYDFNFNSFSSNKPHPFINSLLFSLTEIMHSFFLPENIQKLRFIKQKRLTAEISKMNSLVDDIIKERRVHAKKYNDVDDLLNLMIHAKDPVTNETLDDLNIRYQILTFLIAGHETTSGLLSFAFYLLITNPDTLNIAYHEVDDILGIDTDRLPKFEELSKLKYIGRVLSESLRLYPPAPGFTVQAIQDTVIGSEYEIKVGTEILVLLPALHRDPAEWDNPEQFNPDNFLPEKEVTRNPYAYKPFGNGHRSCIGRAFALQEATLAMALILQRYKLSLKKDYQFSIQETLSIKPKNLEIKLTKRKQSDKYISDHKKFASNENYISKVNDDKVVGESRKVTIFYGSNIGTAKNLALRLSKEGRSQGFETNVQTLDEAINTFPTAGTVFITTSTYNGYPPDNAVKFKEWLNSLDVNNKPFKNIAFSVFGCGNSQWRHTFQTFPTFIYNRLIELGAHCFYEKGAGDANEDFESTFEAWYQHFWQSIPKINETDATVAQATSHSQFTMPKRMLAPLTVLSNQELQSDSSRSTRHIQIQLPHNVSYRAGDYLAVYPKNHPLEIQRLVSRCAININETIIVEEEGKIKSIPIQEFLEIGIEFRETATRRQLRYLAETTNCPPEKQELLKLATTDYSKKVQETGITYLDLLCKFVSCSVNVMDVLEQFTPLKPRYYSISSSEMHIVNQCSITVGVVHKQLSSGMDFWGLCSNFLANVKPGEVLQAEVRLSGHNFYLPSKPETPIIMIATGTGIAPFRGFLQERAARIKRGEKLGKAVLFFGCRHPEQDHIYKNEFANFTDICTIEMAYSRWGEEKGYVQDTILREKATIWDMLKNDASVYICGSTFMANACMDNIEEICKSHREEHFFDDLIKNKKILTDIWTK